MKKIRYFIEAIFLCLAFAIFKVMPAPAASAFGGWIGRIIGPCLAASRKARTNLEKSFPEKSAEEISAIIIDMWDNLGRVFAEYPHLKKIILTRCDVHGLENITAIGPESPLIVMGSHLANWELLFFFFNYKLGWPIATVYREPNNPYVQRLLERARNPDNRGTFIAKSKRGARKIVDTIKNGERLLILIDQKYNEGIPAQFFGRPAMTSTSFTQLARRYDAPTVPLQITRLKGCRFQLTLHPPLTAGLSDEESVAEAHTLLENWIGQNPGQWLWLHRRWDSKALR